MDEAILGRDLKLEPSPFGFGLVTLDGDLGVAEGRDNLVQALLIRLNTPREELAGLGHPDYGSRLFELIGRPNTVSTRNLVRLFTIDALRREPRVGEITSLVVASPGRPPDRVDVSVSLRPIEEQAPLNLVFSVNLEPTP